MKKVLFILPLLFLTSCNNSSNLISSDSEEKSYTLYISSS